MAVRGQPDSLRHKISVRHSPAQEMILSLHVLSEPDHHPESLAWVERVRQDLPSTLLGEILRLGDTFSQYLTVADVLSEAEGPLLGVPVEDVLEGVERMDESLFRTLLLGDGRRSRRLGAMAGDAAADARPQLVRLLKAYWSSFFCAEMALRKGAIMRSVHEWTGALESSDPFDFLKSLAPKLQVDRRECTLRVPKCDFCLDLTALENLIIIPSTFSSPHLMVGFGPSRVMLYVGVPRRDFVRGSVPGGDVPERVLAATRALGDRSRLKILRALYSAERCTQEIAAHMGLTEATISRHLKILKECGLVEGRREGNFIYYTIVPGGIKDTIEALKAFLRRG